jgi:hypothetical protein
VDSEGGEEDDVEEEARVEGKEAKSDREPFDITSVAVKVDPRLLQKNTSSQTTQWIAVPKMRRQSGMRVIAIIVVVAVVGIEREGLKRTGQQCRD